MRVTGVIITQVTLKNESSKYNIRWINRLPRVNQVSGFIPETKLLIDPKWVIKFQDKILKQNLIKSIYDSHMLWSATAFFGILLI